MNRTSMYGRRKESGMGDRHKVQRTMQRNLGSEIRTE